MSNDAPLELDRLIPALVEPFDRPSCPVSIACVGSSVVDQGQANAIALVMGELAVNSAKHGALHHGGSLRVTVEDSAESLTIVRTERPRAGAIDRAGKACG